MRSLLLALFCFTVPAWVNALTVEEAYKAIPHSRAEYDPTRSTRDRSEREYLAALFRLSDRALVQRIMAMHALSDGKPGALATYESEIGTIVGDIESLREPQTATGLGAILVRALHGQLEFFRSWSRAREKGLPFGVPNGTAQSGVDPTIRSASGSLHQLYGELMRRYANESAENKNSFFQYLCALDFI